MLVADWISRHPVDAKEFIYVNLCSSVAEMDLSL
jgi:hypothetical protein